MQDKLVICTLGTSIANGCPSQKDYFSRHDGWGYDIKELEQEIANRVQDLGGDAKRISAETNSLHMLGLTPDSLVVLLATDNALGKASAEQNKAAIVSLFGLKPDNVHIRHIEGLQVHNAQLLRQEGIKNLIKETLKYLTDANYQYQYDIVLNPTGGYKGVLPFLTILGMLYGKRSVYIFEHAEQLMTLPPLPFSFNIEIYNRVKPALDLIDKEGVISEQAYYANIIGFEQAEKPLFASFVETDGEQMVTVSSLAEVLLSIENRGRKPMVSTVVIAQLENDNSIPAKRLKRLIVNSANPLWRMQHAEGWRKTDLTAIKQIATAERLAGYMRDDEFYVAHAFRSHEEYERDLPKFSKATASKLDYQAWLPDDNFDETK